MSKFVGLGKGVKFVVQKFVGKKSPTITSVKPKVGSLTRRRKDQDDVIKSADKAIKKNKLTKEQGVAVKKTIAPGLKKISKTQDDIDRLEKKLSAQGKEKLRKLREKKMGGGFMGRRMGYSQGELVGNQKKIDVAPPFGTINEKDLAKLRARKGQRKGPLKKITKSKRIKGPMETQPPEDPMRDRMKQPLKRNK